MYILRVALFTGSMNYVLNKIKNYIINLILILVKIIRNYS